MTLPRFALSVRQPWAWAIIHGGKVIENRSLGAIRSGGMKPGRICIHAATGMSIDEYSWGLWRLDKHGVTCPSPDHLPRGAIIGTVTVTGIITRSDSPWFGGEAGLTLADATPVDPPIPSRGELGYFVWEAATDLAPVQPWMRTFGRPNADTRTLDLFGDSAPTFKKPPAKPFGKTKA